jgi:hypothetical protein
MSDDLQREVLRQNAAVAALAAIIGKAGGGTPGPDGYQEAARQAVAYADALVAELWAKPAEGLGS